MAISKQTLILGGGVAAAFIAWSLTREVKNTIAGLTFSFGVGGWPQFDGFTSFVIPIKVTVDNAGFTDLPLQSLNINLERVVSSTQAYAIAATEPGGVPVPAIKARNRTTFILPIRANTFTGLTELWTSWGKLGFNKFRVTGTIQAANLSIPIPPVTFTT